MDSASDTSVDALQVDPPPESLGGGSTVLVASAGDPSRYALCLRILRTRGAGADRAFVVSTTESAERTIDVYEQLEAETERPSLGLVDTVSKQQSVAALYGGTPVVFTPSSADLERLVMALSDLSGTASPSSGARHLVVRSLTPILTAAPTARVGAVLDRIIGLRSETGLCLVGLDYTAHDEETMAAVADRVDGVLWVTHPTRNHLGFEYRPTRGRHSRSVLGDEPGD